MRVAHNVRFTSNSHSRAERDELKERYQEWLEQELEFEEEDLVEEGFATLYALKLWLDRQQPVKKALKGLEFSDEDRQKLLKEADKRLDERNNFYFRLEKKAFLEGDIKVVDRGDVIQVRINPAAYPANRDNALAIIQGYLQQA